jgi:hypothetical protein
VISRLIYRKTACCPSTSLIISIPDASATQLAPITLLKLVLNYAVCVCVGLGSIPGICVSMSSCYIDDVFLPWSVNNYLVIGINKGQEKILYFWQEQLLSINWPIWLSRNDTVFDKCKPEAYLYALFKGAQKECLIKLVLAKAMSDLFASYGWSFTFKIKRLILCVIWLLVSIDLPWRKFEYVETCNKHGQIPHRAGTMAGCFSFHHYIKKESLY